jgi:hypothetical protein
MARVTSIKDFEPLTTAERTFIASIRADKPCDLGPKRPDTPSDTRTIRAALLRVMIKGGTDDCPVADAGFGLIGAYITGQLNLHFASAKGRTGLILCHFADPIAAMQAKFQVLALNGSRVPGLNLQGADVTGDVFLRTSGKTPFHATGAVSLAGAKIGGQLACIGARFDNAGGNALNAEAVRVTGDVVLRADGDTPFHATGEVSLAGASIGGQLACDGARFEGAGGAALNAQGVQVTGSVFLRANGNTRFHATGEVSLAGASIGGQLECKGARFEGAGGAALNAEGVQVTGSAFLCAEGNTPFHATGEVSLSGASIGGQLECKGAQFDNAKGDALNAEAVRVTGALFWNGIDGNSVVGPVSFVSAHVGTLFDDLPSWPSGPDQLSLDGFTYDRITGSFTDARRRIEWLKRGTRYGGSFQPQPYTQLANVLRAMGHDRDAREVLHEQAYQLGFTRRDDRKVRPNGDIGVAFKSIWFDLVNLADHFWDWWARKIVGYGYKPFRALWSLIGLWLLATFLAQMAYTKGQFAPNSDVVLVSKGWDDLVAQDCVPDPQPDCIANPAAAWSAIGQQGLDWDTFNSVGYAADLVVPILDLGQTDAWAPSRDRGAWGKALWWGRWVLAAFGWIVTAFGVAAVTGIMQRSAPKE